VRKGGLNLQLQPRPRPHIGSSLWDIPLVNWAKPNINNCERFTRHREGGLRDLLGYPRTFQANCFHSIFLD